MKPLPARRWTRLLVAPALPALPVLLALLALLVVLGPGCSHAPPGPGSAALLRDELFQPAPEPIDASRLFALSAPMQHYADTLLAGPGRLRDRRRALIDALSQPGGLRLSYDAEVTRSAADAFEQRAGNCLSLVIMTAAFARHLALPVRFQTVLVDEEFSRTGDLFLAAGHVNLMLGRRGPTLDPQESQWLTIDFLPQAELGGQRTRPIGEYTIAAMFMNNRAAEALAAGRVAESYWWAREALLQDPAFLPGANTLGVVYSRAGQPAAAERALRHVLEHDADNLSALANLVRLLQQVGRAAEAAPLAARLASLQPYPPFWFFDRAREALERRDFAGARDLLRRELRRQPYQHQVHFELARALAGLGDAAGAARHLALAIENSPTRGQQALYAGKLARLRNDPPR